MAKNESNADLKKVAKVAKHAAPNKTERKRIYKSSGFGRAVPFISVFLGFILLVLIIFNIADAGGAVTKPVEQFFRGLIGGAVWLLPPVMIYLGILWIAVHLKEHSARSKKKGNDDIKGLTRRSARRITTNTILFLFLFSSLLGTWVGMSLSDYSFASLWTEAENFDFIHGGIIGGTVGALLFTGLGKAISSIVLILVLLVTLFYTLGFTVTGIFDMISARKELNEDEIEIDEDAEAKRFEEMRQKEIEKAKKRKLKQLQAQHNEELRKIREEEYGDDDDEPAPAAAKPAKSNAKKAAVEEFDDEEFLENLDKETGEYSDPETQTLELDGDDSAATATAVADAEYGGDSILDENSSSVEELLQGIGEEEPAPKPEAPKKKEELNLEKISEEALAEDLANVKPDEKDDTEEELVTPYIFPPIDMLSPNKNPVDTDVHAELQENARLLKETLKSFKVEIRDISYSRGPTITRYELKPEVGTRVRAIANLVDDIALSLATSGVRIEAPIPNKAAVGIEVPNRNRATVYLRDLIENSKFTDAKSKLTSCLGMDVGGNPVYFDISKMPHLLIAGATGMGKSVCINSIIVSILYKARPTELKLILIDPKKVEFSMYRDIPHLYAPIVSDPKKAAGALASAVSEMERRFELIEEVGMRDIAGYNEATANDPEKEYMPHMVIIIDELADLMMTASDEVESCICRLAQKARAAGIHLIIGTQRPSVDVITGLIKANIPSRIACTVTSQVDSRTIIDIAGAEKLIGRGDMLFAPVGASKPMRVQGAFVSEGEIEKIVSFVKENNSAAKYNSAFISSMEENAKMCGMSKKAAAAAMAEAEGETEGGDSKFRDAVKLAIEEGKISTSLMQRRLSVGYGRAAKIIDTMEQLGYVSKPDGNKPRRVLITMEEYMNRINEGTLGGENEE